MPVLMKDGRAVLLVHIPKTGGTSLERHFVQNGWAMHYRDGHAGEGTLNSYQKCSPQHIEARRLAELFRLERFDVIIATVREPLSRFRSEYCMRNVRDLRTDAESVDAWSRNAFEAYTQDSYVFDNHLRPQAEFVVPGGLVYRLEAGLDRMVQDLNERYAFGLAGDIPRLSDREIENGVRSDDVELSPRLQRHLRNFYARDFQEFDY